MRIFSRHLVPAIIQQTTDLTLRLLAAVLGIFMLQACGSGSTVLGGAPVSSGSNTTGVASATTSPIATGTTSGEGIKSGTSNAPGTGTGPGTNTNTNTGTSTSNVSPSFNNDPAAAVQRIHLTTTLLRGFEKFFGNPFGSVVPTANKDGDFRYLDCNGLRICRGSVSLTRTFKTLGTDGLITPGTAYAWYFQNYNANGAGAIPTIELNGTAYLAFAEGFSVGASTYNGKASLYIKTKPPETVIDFEGSINAFNLSAESSGGYNNVGKLEITPNNQPTWMIDFNNWRAFQGSGIEDSKLTITESGQTAELTVELASNSETIYVMTYQLNGNVTTTRIRKTWETGVDKFERL